MKNKIASVIIIAVLFAFTSIYNKQASNQKENSVAWGEVMESYKRRENLIPYIVLTAKTYVTNRDPLVATAEALQQVVNVRAETAVDLPLKMEAINKFSEAQDQLSSALSQLVITADKYPELKADKNFIDLQCQLKNVENGINTACNNYNKTVSKTKTSNFLVLIVNFVGGIDKYQPYENN